MIWPLIGRRLNYEVAPACVPKAFEEDSEAYFLDSLREYPNNRRVTSAVRALIIGPLVGDTLARTSQRDVCDQCYLLVG